MGEHKYNPTAIAAKNGEIPPKGELEAEIFKSVLGKMNDHLANQKQDDESELTDGCDVEATGVGEQRQTDCP